MRFLLFLPALFFFSLGIIGAISRSRREARQWQEAEAARIAKAEAAARARLKQNASKTVCTAAAPSQPKRKRGRPRKTPAAPPRQPKQPDPIQPQPVPEKRPGTISESAQPFRGNNVFAGQVVAFTGIVQGMTRAEAIQAVWDNGGKAFDAITADTTLLIVGATPAASELAQFPQLPRITADHFKFRLAAPLTVSTDEFAAHFAATQP